jgi:transducin (beta)-like 1
MDDDDDDDDEGVNGSTNGENKSLSSGGAGSSKKKGASSSSSSSSSTNLNLVQESDVTTLRGHMSEVFICAWNPQRQDVLASGSGDSTARIWHVPEKQQGGAPLTLRHGVDAAGGGGKDVTTLEWNRAGTKLATGSDDGLVRIWSAEGALLLTLAKHTGPIFSLKWNERGDNLLSGSFDRTAVVWDASSGAAKQQFPFHTAPTLDVDWRNNESFATCSSDHMIYVCELGRPTPLRCMKGHKNEVNAIKWDPSGALLASCSDDTTAKIWSMNQEHCLHDLTEHQREIYTITWRQGGASQSPLLATASFDTTIKLWDAATGQCRSTLEQHNDPVYSVAFSPDGQFLASGSFDRRMHIWNVADGSLVKTFEGDGGIFEVCWNNAGTRVAACFSNNTLSVVDLRV